MSRPVRLGLFSSEDDKAITTRKKVKETAPQRGQLCMFTPQEMAEGLMPRKTTGLHTPTPMGLFMERNEKMIAEAQQRYIDEHQPKLIESAPKYHTRIRSSNSTTTTNFDEAIKVLVEMIGTKPIYHIEYEIWDDGWDIWIWVQYHEDHPQNHKMFAPITISCTRQQSSQDAHGRLGHG